MTGPAGEAPGTDFADVLADLIREADMTIPEVAGASGLDDQTIRTYLSGTRKPRLPSVRRLESVLPDREFTMRQALGMPPPPVRHDEIDQDVPWAPEKGPEPSVAELVRQIAALAEKVSKIEEALSRADRGSDPAGARAATADRPGS